MLGLSGPNKFELDQDARLLGPNKVPLENGDTVKQTGLQWLHGLLSQGYNFYDTFNKICLF